MLNIDVNVQVSLYVKRWCNDWKFLLRLYLHV